MSNEQTIHERLAEVRGAIGTTLPHDAKGHFGGYTSLRKILTTIEGPMRAAELMVVTETSYTPGDTGIVLTIDIVGTDGKGAGLGCSFPIKSLDPMEVGKSVSYFRRYGLQMLLGITTDDDVDNHPPGVSVTDLKIFTLDLAGGDKELAARAFAYVEDHAEPGMSWEAWTRGLRGAVSDFTNAETISG